MPLTEEQKQARAETRRRNDALRAEADALLHEAKRREWQEKGMYLTREQAAAGEPCRGCGLPVIDGLGSWAPLMQPSEQEKLERQAADATFAERHRDCHAHRWSMEGSQATHCGLCCPPLPLSLSQVETISRILKSVTRRDEEFDVWTRTLTCGHLIEQTVHHINSGPSFSTHWCPDCQITRGVVFSVKTVEAATRMPEAKQKRDSAVRCAERDVEKAKAALAATERKLAELRILGSV